MNKVNLTIDKLGKIIERNPWAKNMEWAEIEILSKYLDAFQAEKNETIFVEGEQKPFMIMILRGSVRVFKEDSAGHMQVISEIKAGKILGEMSLVDGAPRSASAVAIEETIYLRMTNESFQKIIDQSPRLGVKIYAEIARLLSQRLRHTSGHLVEYMQLKGPGSEDEDIATTVGESTMVSIGAFLAKSPEAREAAKQVTPAPVPTPPPTPLPGRMDQDDGIPKDIHIRSYVLHPDKIPEMAEVVQVVNILHRRMNRLDQWVRLQRAATDANRDRDGRPQDPQNSGFLKGLFK